MNFLTVLYADIFDWPLTHEELILWSIRPGIRKVLFPQKGYYFLPKRNNLIAKRIQKEKHAAKKWIIARRVARFMQVIPTLSLVGVTGGLSRNNVRQDDDIDFFCITKRDTLWTSRFFSILVVELLGVRRKPGEVDVTNKICLNMFMSEDALSVNKKEQDLFAAYEVLQMTPLWEREGSYKKFLTANRWAQKFLPNAWKSKVRSCSKKNIPFSFPLFPFRFFEPLARILQLWYMKNRRTSEVIAGGVLRFHPRDARRWIKRAFEKRLSRYNFPLDKVFYAR